MIRKIEIELPIEMDVPDVVFMKIDELLTEYLCKPYKKEHPERTMWVSGHGSKPSFSRIDAALLGKCEWDEGIPDGAEPRYDDSVYQISISERERY